MQPCLVVYDDDKNAFWAMGIKSKAVKQSMVKYFNDLQDQSGYEGEKITMKSDQEPSILALKRGGGRSLRRDCTHRVAGQIVKE